MAALARLPASVGHPAVRAAVAANVRAVVVVAVQERSARIPAVFVLCLRALAALFAQFPVDALQSIPSRNKTKEDLASLFAAMQQLATGVGTSTEAALDVADGDLGEGCLAAHTPERHDIVGAALHCLSTMVSPQNADHLCALPLPKLVLALLGTPAARTDGDIARWGLEVAHTLARGSDTALALFGTPASLRIFVTLTRSSDLKKLAPVQFAGIRVFAAVVRARHEYPASIGGGSAKQFAANLMGAEGEEALLGAIEEHRAFADLLPVAYRVLTHLHRRTLSAHDLGGFAQSDAFLPSSNIASASRSVPGLPVFSSSRRIASTVFQSYSSDSA